MADAKARQHDLGVESQQVVLGQAESGDRRHSSDPGMRSMPIVAMHEEGQFEGTLF